jgi:RimJ/RimL family protein N-acetyltransferase
MPLSTKAATVSHVHGDLTLEPWTADDLAVLEQQDSPEMTRFLGGPEGAERLRARQAKYLRDQATGVTWPFTVRRAGMTVGSVVYWEMEHDGQQAYECGWGILPGHQGHGYGTRAVRLMFEHAARHGARDLVYAFPRIDNDASNGIARSAGFRFEGTIDGEYPKGVPIRVNAWAFDLRALR